MTSESKPISDDKVPDDEAKAPDDEVATLGPAPELVLKLGDNEKILIAVIPAPHPNTPHLTNVELMKKLVDEGYGAWKIDEKALVQVSGLLGKVGEETELAVAECLDGEFNISVSDDDLEVRLEIVPAFGGKAVTEMQVLNALAEQKIRNGIDKSAIDLNSREVMVIARGSDPVDGEDSRFESLIPDVQDKRPKINDDGSVDYFEIGAFITVETGDALMRRFPPTNGTNGVDIYSKSIMATPGKVLEYSSRMKGAELDANDRDYLIAANGGQPEIIDRGMQVIPVINLENADLTTGNIDFDGTVNIKGDVMEGLSIFATGDVIVAGMTEGAEIQAEGNIVVQKGVIGRGKLFEDDGTLSVGAAHLKSGGSIEARFVENALIEAAKDVTVSELISHSEVRSQNIVKVGKKGSKKAHIRGGRVSATVSVEAEIIGSPANVKTEIDVGNDPELKSRLHEVTHQLMESEGEFQKLSTLVSRLRNQKDEKSKALLMKALNSLKEALNKIETFKKEEENLKKRNELSESACVVVGKNAYPGVKIIIDEEVLAVQRMTEAGKFVLKDGEVIIQYN